MTVDLLSFVNHFACLIIYLSLAYQLLCHLFFIRSRGTLLSQCTYSFFACIATCATRGLSEGRCVACLGTSEVFDAAPSGLDFPEGVSVSTGMFVSSAYVFLFPFFLPISFTMIVFRRIHISCSLSYCCARHPRYSGSPCLFRLAPRGGVWPPPFVRQESLGLHALAWKIFAGGQEDMDPAAKGCIRLRSSSGGESESPRFSLDALLVLVSIYSSGD